MFHFRHVDQQQFLVDVHPSSAIGSLEKTLLYADGSQHPETFEYLPVKKLPPNQLVHHTYHHWVITLATNTFGKKQRFVLTELATISRAVNPAEQTYHDILAFHPEQCADKLNLVILKKRRIKGEIVQSFLLNSHIVMFYLIRNTVV